MNCKKLHFRGKRVKVETATMWPVQVSDEMDKWEQWLPRLGLSHHGVPVEGSTGMVPAFCMTRMFFLLCAEPQPWTFSPFFWGILWKEVHSADARSSHTSLIDGNNEGVGEELIRAVSIHDRPGHICPNSCVHSVLKTICLTVHRPLHWPRRAGMPNTDVQVLKTSTVNFAAP